MSAGKNKVEMHAEAICRMVLRPVISMLLRIGLPFNRFSEICRSVYVEVAREQFGVDGRRTNTSRIALLTGLSRTRVKQERDAFEGKTVARDESFDQVRPASRILMAWHIDKAFLNADGKPRELEVENGPSSFKTLYDKYSGKVAPMTTILKELQNVGAIQKTNAGRLRVLSRTYMPQPTDPQAVKRVCMAIRDLAETGVFNLYRNESQHPRFERFSTNQLIPRTELKNFNAFLDKEGQAFLERVDNWLSDRESTDSTADNARIGLGIYQISPWEKPGAGKGK
ncbi:MAG: hypothetical protein KJO35_07275 [Gammaproteobacteria bacterium]|nr:hypothetical protein [Gammaproteobacteria bacterium]